jgi:hypothetical protein
LQREAQIAAMRCDARNAHALHGRDKTPADRFNLG